MEDGFAWRDGGRFGVWGAFVMLWAILAGLIVPVFAAQQTPGDPLPRVVCPAGYEAFVYAEGLSSPDGLAFDGAGVLHVAEESSGRVVEISPTGVYTPVVTSLASPEGIAFDGDDNLYVVEDVEDGRLVRVDGAGVTTTLATNLDAPEGVVWNPNDNNLYLTQSNVPFTGSPLNYRSRVSRVTLTGTVSTIVNSTILWSYSGITLGADGFLYVANEAAGTSPTSSVYRVNPAGGSNGFVADLVATEGVRFPAGGNFPLYIIEEDLGTGNGQLNIAQADGQATPFCTGFFNVEDVALDASGNLYVSEDTTGLIIQIVAPEPVNYPVYLPVLQAP